MKTSTILLLVGGAVAVYWFTSRNRQQPASGLGVNFGGNSINLATNPFG